MGEKQGSKPTISLSEVAGKVLVVLRFLEIVLPHLQLLLTAIVEQKWAAPMPKAVIDMPTEVRDAA